MHDAYDQTVQRLAGEAYALFYSDTRDDGASFVALKNEAPEWLRDIVYEAHADFGPDDFRYDVIQDAFGAIHDADPSYLDDLDHEFSDNVDVYTGQLTAWLASNINRLAYCDEAVEEGLIEPDADMSRRLMIGQYMERREVFAAVLHGLREHAEEIDDAEEGDDDGDE